jgi:hypothetical protein
MGCDIHCYMEYRRPSGDRWLPFGARINPGRNYRIFGRLAGVRREQEPHVKPRGLPADVGWRAQDDAWIFIHEDGGEDSCKPEDAARWAAQGLKYRNDRDGKPTWIENPDWHSHSWATPTEWEVAISHPEDGDEIEYRAMLHALRYFESSGYEARVVFWFDN